MIEKSVVVELTNYPKSQNPVTSAYITVDNNAESRGKHILELKKMIQYKKNTSYFKELNENEQNSVLRDFEKILEWMKSDFDSKEYNSVIIFSSEQTGFWKTIVLKQKMKNMIEIHSKPYIRPLTTLFDDYRKYAIVLVDKAKGRILESNYGEFSEIFNIKDAGIEDMKTGGYQGTEERKIERNNRKNIIEHYKRIADKVNEFDKANNYKWLVIGGRKESINEFENYLHNQAKDKIAGNLIVEPSSNIKKVLKAVQQTEREARARFEIAYVDMFHEKKQNKLAAEGINEVIVAAKAQQIDTLFVKENYKIKGKYCPNDCFISADMAEECPECGENLERTDDLVEHILHKTVNQSSKIKYVNGSFDNHGKIVAYLRFPKIE